MVGIGRLPGLEIQHVLKHERGWKVLWEARNKCVNEVGQRNINHGSLERAFGMMKFVLN